MHLKIFGFAFGITSLLLSFLLIFRFFMRKKSFSTRFIALIAVFMLLYILEAVYAFTFNGNTFLKTLSLFFGLSPFVIGYLTTYRTQDFFGIVQILAVVCGFCSWYFAVFV